MSFSLATDLALDAVSRLLELISVSRFCDYALPDGELDAPSFALSWTQVDEGVFSVEIRIWPIWDGRRKELDDAVAALSMVPAVSKVRSDEADDDLPAMLTCTLEIGEASKGGIEVWLSRYHQNSVRSTWRRM